LRFWQLLRSYYWDAAGAVIWYGGTINIDLPVGEKLAEVTWKDNNLWYLTRPMREGEEAETWTFQEKSNYGVMEGKVILKEKK
jgi:hypothetical protein